MFAVMKQTAQLIRVISYRTSFSFDGESTTRDFFLAEYSPTYCCFSTELTVRSRPPVTSRSLRHESMALISDW